MRRLLLLFLLPAGVCAAPVARRAAVRPPQTIAATGASSFGPLSAPSLFSAPSLSLNPADSPLALPRVEAAAAESAARIILPETTPLVAGERPRLILPEKKKIIIPDAPVIERPGRMIVEAERELSEEERDPKTMPDAAALKALAKSLSGEKNPGDADASAGEMAALRSGFDGGGWTGGDLAAVRAYFADGPRAPDLKGVEAAAHALFRGLLPAHYRRLPATVRYDRSENPSTGHLWSAETGHIIELAPVSADTKGDVPSVFGHENAAFVSQKVEQLLQFAHEYAHVIFDAAVRKTDNHAPLSSYAAMTEGFAVTMEQALVERIISNPMLLGLSARDAGDFVKIAAARRDWLAALDNHYSEGMQSWWKAFKSGGDEAVSKFLASLSAARMTKTPRADSAYQLAAGDADLLSAYLGQDKESSMRRGLEAFAKAAGGAELDAEETALAAAASEAAGPQGRRRVFIRSLLEDKRIPETAERRPGARWYEEDAKTPLSITPAFALARLSAAAAEELAQFLTEALRQGNGRSLFGSPVRQDKVAEIAAAAETLTLSAAARAAWNEALTAFLFGGKGFSV